MPVDFFSSQIENAPRIFAARIHQQLLDDHSHYQWLIFQNTEAYLLYLCAFSIVSAMMPLTGRAPAIDFRYLIGVVSVDFPLLTAISPRLFRDIRALRVLYASTIEGKTIETVHPEKGFLFFVHYADLFNQRAVTANRLISLGLFGGAVGASACLLSTQLGWSAVWLIESGLILTLCILVFKLRRLFRFISKKTNRLAFLEFQKYMYKQERKKIKVGLSF